MLRTAAEYHSHSLVAEFLLHIFNLKALNTVYDEIALIMLKARIN
jgi:hypothetical protein